MLKLFFFEIIFVLSCYGRPQQQNIDDIVNSIFTSPRSIESSSRRGGFAEIVTAEPLVGPSVPLLEGNDNPSCKCVPYYLCNSKNNSITERVDSFGQIDIGVNQMSCPDILDICCGEQKIQEKPIPIQPIVEKPNRVKGCGIRNPGGIDFELLGNLNNEAGFAEFPWTVALIDIVNQKYFCAGSLIHPQVVLTGNHCVRKLSPRSFKVRAGEWDTQTVKERLPYQERFATQILSHPDYVIETVANDFALIVLERQFELAEHIQNICLPPQNDGYDNIDCYVSGWGKDIFGQDGKHSVIMKRVLLPIVPNNICENSLRGTRLGVTYQLSSTFVCAGGKKGVDACQGDGGAPLVCPVGNPSNNRYSQRGIVAWGIGCNEDRPAVYANVAGARNWIDSQINKLGYDTSLYSY